MPVKLNRLPFYIRQRIVNLRNSGKTFVQIESILTESEGVKVSRFAIGKFYKRYRLNGSKPCLKSKFGASGIHVILVQYPHVYALF